MIFVMLKADSDVILQDVYQSIRLTAWDNCIKLYFRRREGEDLKKRRLLSFIRADKAGLTDVIRPATGQVRKCRERMLGPTPAVVICFFLDGEWLDHATLVIPEPGMGDQITLPSVDQCLVYLRMNVVHD